MLIESPSPEKHSAARRESRTILLIDNSAAILSSLSLLLKRLEYRVVTARSAGDSFRLMETAAPLVIITELSLPDMSGLDFVKKIRESRQSKAVPVIVLTSLRDRSLENACRRLGCAAYLQKPADPELLYRAIQEATESSPRRHVRLKTTLAVLVGDDSAIGGSLRQEQTTALSEGGLFIMTKYPQPRAAVTPLRLTLGGRVVCALAEVVYTYKDGEGPYAEPGMGMKFVRIADEDRALIREFIRKQLLDESGIDEGRESPLPTAPVSGTGLTSRRPG